MNKFAAVLRAAALLVTACGGGGGDDESASGGLSTITTATLPPTTGTSGDTPTTAGPGDMSTSTASGGSLGETGSSGADTSSGTSSGTSTGTTAAVEGTSTGTSSSSGAPPDKEPCEAEKTTVEPVPPYILLVLDKSGSMSMEQWDHDAKPQTANVTRWYSLFQVVDSVLKGFDAVAHFGLKLYPKIDAGSYDFEGACVVNPGVEVPIAPLNAAAVLDVLPPSDFEVLGGTPMETGLREAYKYLKTIDPKEQRFALLIADGEISQTCQGENFFEALALVEDAYDLDGISTYVVGIDVDGDTYEQLASLGDAGGKPKPGPEPFYQTTNQTELEAAIQSIIDDTLSCVIAVDPAPSEPDLFEVHVGGTSYKPVGDCASGNGWVWTAPHTEIELCGEACAKLKETGEVEALYFCTPG